MTMQTLLNDVKALALKAGDEIVAIAKAGFEVEHKNDASPVTIADQRANEIITTGLAQLTPAIPVISEESDPQLSNQPLNEFWLVDPLDGTKGFIEGHVAYTVNIALVQNGEPILGVVHAPGLGCCYYALAGEGSFKQADNNVIPLKTCPFEADFVRVAGSLHHSGRLADLLYELNFKHHLLPIGSALKFCQLAEKGVDIYPRLGPTSLWDTAAGQCVLTVAGGQVWDLKQNVLKYAPHQSLINPPFLAVADPNFAWDDYCQLSKWDNYL